MTFAREIFSEALVEEMKPLWEKHHQETAAYMDIPLDPNVAVYGDAETRGTLRIYTARQGRKLVGYQIFFIMLHPHCISSLQAVQDILFIDKGFRLGLVGYKFIRWCGEELKKEGVQVIFQHISAAHDFGRMLLRMGYQHVDSVYGRRLDLCQQPSQS